MSRCSQHPDQYDGIVARVAVNNRIELLASQYPAIVINQDLSGVAPTKEQLTLVSNAAIAAFDRVGGEHLRFIVDYESCRYDPTKDKGVLCLADVSVQSAHLDSWEWQRMLFSTKLLVEKWTLQQSPPRAGVAGEPIAQSSRRTSWPPVDSPVCRPPRRLWQIVSTPIWYGDGSRKRR